ncbi:MAG: hypothetical protein JNL19_09625 [Burkholderiales bacterium]|nr:hypothetical protein [Burkholderiales bacterium]
MDPITLLVGGALAAAFVAGGSDTYSYTPPSGGKYRFQLREVNGEWRAYILEQPGYAGRASDGHSSHRYYDSARSQYYVCWEPAPRTKEAARAVSKLWAEKTTRYCRHGASFA